MVTPEPDYGTLAEQEIEGRDDAALTCEHCKHAPATHLLIADVRSRRMTALACRSCGDWGIKTAERISGTAMSAWLFALTPADPGATSVHDRLTAYVQSLPCTCAPGPYDGPCGRCAALGQWEGEPVGR